MIRRVWEPPVWWTSLWVGVLLVALALWVLAGRRGRAGEPGPTRTPAEPDAADAPAAWLPVIEPMGPVSGWPYTLDDPDAPPTRSPDDRPDLWATLP